MRLTLHKAERSDTKFGGGDVHVYSVAGLPDGENAKIGAFNDSWRILRWNETWHGNWTGQYPTPEAALAALQSEVFASV